MSDPLKCVTIYICRLVKEGDTVIMGDALCEVQSDKVSYFVNLYSVCFSGVLKNFVHSLTIDSVFLVVTLSHFLFNNPTVSSDGVLSL